MNLPSSPGAHRPLPSVSKCHATPTLAPPIAICVLGLALLHPPPLPHLMPVPTRPEPAPHHHPRSHLCPSPFPVPHWWAHFQFYFLIAATRANYVFFWKTLCPFEKLHFSTICLLDQKDAWQTCALVAKILKEEHYFKLLDGTSGLDTPREIRKKSASLIHQSREIRKLAFLVKELQEVGRDTKQLEFF